MTHELFQLRFTNQQFETIFKLSIYAWSLLPESDKSSAMIYQLLDKKKRYFREKSISDYDRPLYGLDPHRSYRIPYRESWLHLSFEIMDTTQLYAYMDKNKFEKVYECILEGVSFALLESFIEDALNYHCNEFLLEKEDQNTITVFHYTDFWDHFQKIPSRSIQHIYLPKKQARQVLEDVQHFLSQDTKKRYQKFCVPYHRTYCFFGPPGTGKTSLIQAIASEIQKQICIIRFDSSFKDSYLANALRWLPKDSILVLEDIDAIIQDRDETHGQLTFSGVLNIIDGLSSIDGLITFTTTNHLLKLDEAVRRPGRIDYFLEFKYICKEQLELMIQTYYPQEKEDVDTIYKQIQKYNLTVSYLQNFLFSLYPNGKILQHLDQFIADYLKLHQSNQSSSLYL